MDSIGPKGLQNDNDTNSSMRQKSQISYTALRIQHDALEFHGSYLNAHSLKLTARSSLLIAHAPMLATHCSSLKAKRPHHLLPQSIEFFHFFVQKRIDVFCVNERCVQIAVAQEFACRRERDADGNARCRKRVAGQMTMQILAHP